MIAIEPQTPQSGDSKVTMMYDYMGRRVEKKAYSYNGSVWTEDYTKHFLYDGWNLVKETTTENSTKTAKYYTWGLDLSQSLQGAGGIGGLIATVSDSDTNYHCYDLNGNKTQLIAEADGSITAHIKYDPFGNEITSYGLSSADDSFRFSTKYHDSEYKLYYYGYRYYVPDLGRWLTRDPIGERGGKNLYCHVKNETLNFWDYLGKEIILTNYSDADEAFYIAMQSFWNNGPRSFNYEPDHPWTKEMQKHHHFDDVREIIKEVLAENCEGKKGIIELELKRNSDFLLNEKSFLFNAGYFIGDLLGMFSGGRIGHIRAYQTGSFLVEWSTKKIDCCRKCSNIKFQLSDILSASSLTRIPTKDMSALPDNPRGRTPYGVHPLAPMKNVELFWNFEELIYWR